MAYDITTDVGKVRLLISDVGGRDGNSFLYADNEIEVFLELKGSVRGAAAQALRALAGNEAQVSKRIQFLDLTTDGPAVARSLMELATRYEEEQVIAEEEEGDIDIATMGVDLFSQRELRGL